MRFRWVALLVTIYLALDFANPMMPGAFEFDESLDMNAGSPARRDSAAVVPRLPRPLSTVVLPGKPTLPAGRVISVSPLAPILFRAPFESRSTLASSSDDD